MTSELRDALRPTVFAWLHTHGNDPDFSARKVEQMIDALLPAIAAWNTRAGSPSPDMAELQRLSENATPGPWCIEQCGDKCDAPVIGIAWREDDVNCEHPQSGWLQGFDDDGKEIKYYRETIAYEIQDCDGSSASSNAAFIVACVNYVRAQLASPSRPDARLREAVEALAGELEADASVYKSETGLYLKGSAYSHAASRLRDILKESEG